MTIQIDGFSKPHTLHLFDSELGHLHSLVIEMMGLVMYQLDQTMQAFDHGEIKLAQKIMSKSKEINHYQLEIDNEVMTLLALNSPVANDLRNVISTSKIAVELQNMSAEIYSFARLMTVFCYPKTSPLNSKLFSDIVKIGNLVNMILIKLLIACEDKNASQVYSLLQNGRECQSELQEGVRHQLTIIMQDPRMIGRALGVMQMMNALERCNENCKNIAEYMIFMIDGIDVRHVTSRTQG